MKKIQLKNDFHHAEQYIQDTIENMPVVDVTFPESWNDMLSELRVYWRQIKDIQDKRTICDILPARIKIKEMDTFITHNLTALVNKLCKTANALVEKDWNAPMESANDLFITANIKKEIIICTHYLSVGCDLRNIEECIKTHNNNTRSRTLWITNDRKRPKNRIELNGP